MFHVGFYCCFLTCIQISQEAFSFPGIWGGEGLAGVRAGEKPTGLRLLGPRDRMAQGVGPEAVGAHS